jgi:hypothetical protein
VQDYHPPVAPGARQSDSADPHSPTRTPQKQNREQRTGLGFFSMLLTGGILGIALAVLRDKFRARAITLDDYRRLDPGMSYEQVASILGQHGTDISVSAGSKLLAWRNRDGSRLAALFQDGLLVCYGASGLK